MASAKKMGKNNTFFNDAQRASDERSKTPATRARSSRSSSQKAYQEVEQKQEYHQEPRSFQEAIIRVFLKDSPTFLRTIVTFACLFVFLQTRDASWVVTAIAIATGYSIPQIGKTLLPVHKGSSQREDEAP